MNENIQNQWKRDEKIKSKKNKWKRDEKIKSKKNKWKQDVNVKINEITVSLQISRLSTYSGKL